jgi:pentatricopeptide repeat protein
MVVVDTGSTDDSRRAAAEAAARVFEFPWRDDFSAARNFSLEQATSDWIVWFDADDILPAASGQLLRQKIAERAAPDAAFWVSVEEHSVGRRGQPLVRSHSHIKLFPRHQAIRFRYRIHEQVAPAINALGLPILPSHAVVRHAHVDRSPAGEQARVERNLRLALLDLEEHPDDPFVWLSVGTSYLFQPGRMADAIAFLRRSAGGLRRGSSTQLNAYLYLGQAWGTSGNRQQEEQIYLEAAAIFPNDAVLAKRLADLYAKAGRLEDAARCYRQILERGQLRSSVVQVGRLADEAALRLGDVHIRLGQRMEAERCWKSFLRQHPDADAVRRALQKSYLQPCSFTSQAPLP